MNRIESVQAITEERAFLIVILKKLLSFILDFTRSLTTSLHNNNNSNGSVLLLMFVVYF